MTFLVHERGFYVKPRQKVSRTSKSSLHTRRAYQDKNEKKSEYSLAVYQLFIDFKRPLFQFTMKLVGLVKACLNETCSTLQEGKHLSEPFCIKNGLKEGDVLLPLF